MLEKVPDRPRGRDTSAELFNYLFNTADISDAETKSLGTESGIGSPESNLLTLQLDRKPSYYIANKSHTGQETASVTASSSNYFWGVIWKRDGPCSRPVCQLRRPEYLAQSRLLNSTAKRNTASHEQNWVYFARLERTDGLVAI